MASDDNKKLLIGGAIGMIAIAVAITAYSSWPEKKFANNQAYFTDDDGKTWFLDSRDNIPPYTRNGKEAVGVALYNTANNSKPFAGYLTRFPSQIKQRLETLPVASRAAAAYGSEVATQLEVKKPNTPGPWVPMSSPEGSKAMSVFSPDGSELDSVLP